jgi:hypothetical protein
VEQWCFGNGEKDKNLLNSGVSAMGKRQKVVEQSCFNNGGKDKKLLNNGVSAMGKLGSS